ncbi:MAG: XRE family transcriptional regulator [Pseudomonadota bacterium]
MRKQASEAQGLANHLRSLRERRELTLAAVAARSGVSRATLSRIENAEVSPTAETLSQLAAAYALPISQLLAPLDPGFQPVVPQGEQSLWRDPSHAFLRRSVSPPSGQLSIELIECEIGPNEKITYDRPALPGQEQHLYLLSGKITVTVEQRAYALKTGDCLRYSLFGETVFATGEAACRYVIALT